jgi:hypothetical protein
MSYAKFYRNQPDVPLSSGNVIIPNEVYIPTFKVMPDAPDGRWLSDYEKVQEYLKELERKNQEEWMKYIEEGKTWEEFQKNYLKIKS